MSKVETKVGNQESEHSPYVSKTGSSNRRLVLALLTLGQFMMIVDFDIVQIALPSIGNEFGVSVNGLQWIITSYGLSLAGFLMLCGRVGDLYGHKKSFIIGILLFSVASLVAGLSPSEGALILSRSLQGLGAAMVSASGLSILVAIFPEGRERNKALSVFAAVTGAGVVVGLIAGGVTTATLGWRWVFGINVPIGIVASLLSIKYVPSISERLRRDRHLDLFGALSITVGLMLLVYSLNVAQNTGIGSSANIELFLASLTVLALFVMIEYRSKAPLMPLGFLRKSSVFGANALALIEVGTFVGMMFILTNYVQQVLDYSAFSAGLAFTAPGVAFLAVSGFLSARLVNRFGMKPILIVGMSLQTISYLLLSRISGAESFVGGLLGPMMVNALGTGLAFTAINIAALSETKEGEEGLASGLLNTSRQLGGPMGVAVLLTVANFAVQGPEGQLLQSTATMARGFGYSFLAAALVTGVGIIFALALKEKRRHI